MPIDIIDTVDNKIQVLDDGTTISDILLALEWVKKERARQRGKYQRYYKSKKEAKSPKEELPKRPRGRPRKNTPVEIVSEEN